MNLISTMIAVGIAGTLAMMLADLNTIMVRNNLTARAESDMVAYVNQLRSNIQESTATSVLKGNSISDAVTMHDPLNPEAVVGMVNYKLQVTDPWSVKNIRFDNILPVPAAQDFYRLTVTAVLLADNKRVSTVPVRTRVIGDVYCMAPNRVITKCYGATDPFTMAQTACLASLGTWDANRVSCTPKVVASNDKPITEPNREPSNNDDHGSHEDIDDHDCDHDGDQH